MNYYIRFGDIPRNEHSGVYRGEVKIGEEIGVSVYSAIIDEEENISLGIPLPINKDTLDTFVHLMEYENRPCYLVTGRLVGKGSDGEPLIRNVRIIRKIKYRSKI